MAESAAETQAGDAEERPGFQEERTITDLETLRLLADPLRLMGLSKQA